MNEGGQYGEDRILKLVFRDQPTGLLVDVGAADGLDNSNSFMLLRRPGWKGILIEPEPSQFQQLQKRYQDHPGVTCVSCGIGKKTGEQIFYCGGQVSTFKEDTKRAAEIKHNISYTTTKVHLMGLTELLRQLKVKDPIDFLTIDAEGMNYEAWKTLDTQMFSPKLVCIEGKGYRMLGYEELCQMRGNTFYMREDVCTKL